jgi:hypothetical protein
VAHNFSKVISGQVISGAKYSAKADYFKVGKKTPSPLQAGYFRLTTSYLLTI